MEQKILIFKFLFFGICFLLLNTNALSENIIHGNARIVDGDTIHIGQKKIRLHGIDPPEKEQTCTFQKKNWRILLMLYLIVSDLISRVISVFEILP